MRGSLQGLSYARLFMQQADRERCNACCVELSFQKLSPNAKDGFRVGIFGIERIVQVERDKWTGGRGTA